MMVQQGLAARERDLAACLGDPTLRRALGPIRGTRPGEVDRVGVGVGVVRALCSSRLSDPSALAVPSQDMVVLSA